ncbi:hypothetical protein [Halorussus litoreus]|uniref:hypothetical protein n=1 Tax=Halorussus litoreus TaxID=1710536 RepID=UPI000E27FBBD|nr:hypothetical protein [Halorussus litoreus]
MDSALHSLVVDQTIDLLVPGLALVATLAVGVCVHELLHVIPLALADADYTVTVLPDDESIARLPDDDAMHSTRTDGRAAGTQPPATAGRTAATRSPRFGQSARDGLTTLRNALTGGLMRVEVTHLPNATPDWLVRTAAILPVLLALPLALVAVGVLPDPLAADDAVGTALLVAVTACGLPSPADWAVVWHGSELYDGN